MRLCILALYTVILLPVFAQPYACTSNWDCTDNGMCNITSGICTCDYSAPFGAGYTTFPSNSTRQCNYIRKVQLFAFILEIFGAGFGAGYFYLGYTGYGAGQASLTLAIPIVVVMIFYGSAILARELLEGFKRTVQLSIFAFVSVCAVSVVWVVISIVQFGAYYPIPDSNGVELVKMWTFDRMA